MERRTAPVGPAGNGRRAASAVLVSAGLLVVMAFVKPWGGGAPVVVPIAVPPSPAGATPGATSATPSPSVETDESLVASFCLQPAGWRVFSAERWSDRDVRSWRSAEAVSAASGPTDPAIPITPVASQWIVTLGYCAPISGPDRPADSAVTVFRVLDDGRGGTEVLRLRRLLPGLRASPLGAVFAPPSGRADATGPATGWQDGTYVFRIGSPTRGRIARWLGVRVQIVPRPSPRP